MIKVILESPFMGRTDDLIIHKIKPLRLLVKYFLTKRNIKYARMCVRDSLSRGESPIASHLLYTQKGILNDDIPEERRWGIEAGLAWKVNAKKHVFYIDYGMSTGMEYGIKYATKKKIQIEYRKIFYKN